MPPRVSCVLFTPDWRAWARTLHICPFSTHMGHHMLNLDQTCFLGQVQSRWRGEGGSGPGGVGDLWTSGPLWTSSTRRSLLDTTRDSPARLWARCRSNHHDALLEVPATRHPSVPRLVAIRLAPTSCPKRVGTGGTLALADRLGAKARFWAAMAETQTPVPHPQYHGAGDIGIRRHCAVSAHAAGA